MTREFFVPRWLKAHPVVYMTTHMAILPLIDLYATACDWWVAGLRRPPSGLYWFLIVSYLNGIVVEIGRKTRAAVDEEAGVETYSALWGAAGAIRAWLGAILLTALAAWQAARHVGTDTGMLALLAIVAAGAGVIAVRFLRSSASGSGKSIELMSGVWTLLMYLGLGVISLGVTIWRTAG